MAEDCQQHAETEHAKEVHYVTKRKQDNNCQLNLAFANAVHDPSDKFYGDDEDDNFHIQ